MKNKARIAAVSSLLALAALFLYIWHDPRLDDGALEFAETTPLEVFLIMDLRDRSIGRIKAVATLLARCLSLAGISCLRYLP